MSETAFYYMYVGYNLSVAKKREKSVNSYIVTYHCNPLSCNKTANRPINVKMHFKHVLTASCID